MNGWSNSRDDECRCVWFNNIGLDSVWVGGLVWWFSCWILMFPYGLALITDSYLGATESCVWMCLHEYYLDILIQLDVGGVSLNLFIFSIILNVFNVFGFIFNVIGFALLLFGFALPLLIYLSISIFIWR